jgi:hypothetical protein
LLAVFVLERAFDFFEMGKPLGQATTCAGFRWDVSCPASKELMAPVDSCIRRVLKSL